MQPENWYLTRKDEKAQRLERIGTSTRDIAHEFNNVSNSIWMSAKLLQMGRPENEQHHLLKVLEASALRGAEMVKELLAEREHRRADAAHPGDSPERQASATP